jgi:hypothetical protein
MSVLDSFLHTVPVGTNIDPDAKTSAAEGVHEPLVRADTAVLSNAI